MNKAGVMPKSVHQKWQFSVEIGGFEAGFFTKADLPKVEFDETTFSPGGSMYDQKLPGRASFPDITMEKGSPQEDVEENLLDWVKECIDMQKGAGSLPSEFLKDLDIVQYDRTGEETKRWRLYGAWVKNADYGDVEGGSSDNTIESMTLTYQYFDLL